MKRIKLFYQFVVIITTVAVVAGFSHFIPPEVKNVPKAEAANFTMQTGYYTGTGTDDLVIDGVGFQPNFVMIKDDTAIGTDGVNFKTSVMSGEVSSVLADADADVASNAIQSFNSDGFTVGTDADVNTANVGYAWQAFGGSDCTSNGTFCVGSYMGGGSSQIINTGFQPALVIIKSSTTTSAVFKTSTMATNNTVYFDATAQITTNVAIQTLNSNGFTVGNGAMVNTSPNTYWYVAFKAIAGKMVTGSYTGSGLDNNNITGFGSGLIPDFVFTKSTSTQSAVYNVRESNGDFSYDFIDAIGAIDQIQALQNDGFQVGTSVKANAAVLYHWVGFKGKPEPLSSAYNIQTGYYVGNATDNRQITGIGFMPDLVLIKSSTTATTMRWKTSAMLGQQTIGTVTAAVNTTQIKSLDSNGFTLGTSIATNGNNVIYYYIAITGSSCSSSGTVCVGFYPGNGVTGRIINTVGFQPNFVMLKRMDSTATAAFKTSSMGANVNQWMAAVAETTDGTGMQAFTSTGFTLGTSTSTNALSIAYMFVAFKNVTDKFNVGTYGGLGGDNRNITGFGSGSVTPSFVFVKGTGLVQPVANIRESFGDSGMSWAATADIVNSLQKLIPDGFQVGTDTSVNASGSTYYWVAFGGANAPPNGSGDFTMDTGTYTANNGVAFNVTGLDFAPDLVILKGNNTQVAVFRTRMMGGDSTAHMSGGIANFAGGITALNSDGFSIGTSAIVNPLNLTDVYYWEAFGNAFKPDTRTGAANFAIGAYYGNAIDNRDITVTGIDPDFVAVKRSGATAGVWSTTTIGSDNTLAFAATANTADIIQLFNSDGFQIGANAGVNTAANVYWWFAFKETANLFDVNLYRGNGSDDRSIATVGFQPDLVWTKKYGATARAAVMRSSTITGDSAQEFGAVANAANKIQAFQSGGFQVGTDTTVNESGVTTAFDYYYAAWKMPATYSLGITAPTDITLTTGSVGTTVDTTFGTGEKVTVTDGGAGWTLSARMMTALTSGSYTIPNTSVYLRKDGNVGSSDTYTIWSGTYTNVSETNATESLDTSRTIGTRSSGTGGDSTEVRPSVQVVIPPTQYPAPDYAGSLRFTVV